MPRDYLGTSLQANGSQVLTKEMPFSITACIADPAGARIFMVWRAPYACTVTNVRGHRKGGTGATVNARKNQASDHLASDLSLTSADTWLDGGSVQNTSYAVGDDMEVEVASIAGAVTELVVQIDFVRA
jgi:hypothetical protein